MATALAYPDSEQGKRKGTSLKIKEVGLNAGYISQARFVLRHCRDKIRFKPIRVSRETRRHLTKGQSLIFKDCEVTPAKHIATVAKSSAR